MDSTPYGRVIFSRILAQNPKGPFKRAARFWYLNRVCFGGRRMSPTFGVQCSRRTSVLSDRIWTNLEAMIERLRGVSFESVDLVRLIELYDRPTTLFYVDPPYLGTCQDYACKFQAEDHLRLRQTLGKIRGTFLLSYNDCPEVRALYGGFKLLPVDTRYTAGSNASNKASSEAHELVISNRAIRPSESTSQAAPG